MEQQHRNNNININDNNIVEPGKGRRGSEFLLARVFCI